MGLRDLFKDKKKEAFKEKAKEVAKGKLAPGKAEELAAVAREHGLTSNEAQELARIQKFLALRDDQVEKRRWDLTRLRTVTDIRQGHLILTGKRLFLRAGKSAAVEYSAQANLFLYSDGLRIERTVGNTILRFKSKSDGTAEIVGELLSALMR